MLNCQNPTIAIIDSGIGGVSILRQLINKFHAGNYIYYADNLYMPYGNKTKQWLKKRIDILTNEIQNKYNADYIIIACNTASANIDKDNYKNVITMSFESDLIYFATPLTKKALINKEVIADKTLAKEIEHNIFNLKKLEKIIKRHVKLHNLNNLNSYILGCTHYELVKPIFESCCPNSKIINNSEFIINSLNFNNQVAETNVVIKLSKQDEKTESSILKLIKSSN